jgi:hypothetical protein
LKRISRRRRRLVNERIRVLNNLQGTLKNGLFAQTLRYAQNFILGISTICLR